MDVLSQKICPQIDGVKCVKDIAFIVQIDADLVGRCIRNLCFYGCITLLPLFLYSNTYVATEKIRKFFESPKIIKQCLSFVIMNPAGKPVLFSDLCHLYLNLKRGTSLKEWCQRMHPRQLNVDERKLIQFGVYYGFVRKLLVYPIANDSKDETTKSSSAWRVRIALNLKGINYTQQAVNLLHHQQNTEEIRQKLPFGLLPGLVVDDDVDMMLTESLAIIEYLEEKYPETKTLLPGTPEDRAQIRSLALQIIANTQPLQNLRVLEHISPEAAKRKEWAAHWITQTFAGLETILAKVSGKYAYKDAVSLIDVCIPPQMYSARRFGVNLTPYPTLVKIDKMLTELPEFKNADAHRQPDTPETERKQ